MNKATWTRDQKLVVISVLVAVAIGMSAFFVPEVRYFLRLEKRPEATHTSVLSPPSATPQTTPTQTQTQTTDQPKQEPTTRPKKVPASQKKVTRVKGNNNVAGNNVAGNNNVVGTGNQTAPTAVAPNGIAISGGNVSNPTVNNITALPDVTMSDEQEKQVSDSIGDLFAGADVTVTAVQPNQNTRDVSSRLVRIFKSKGANLEYNTAQMYVPAAGMTLHKGVSITSFPSERKTAVDTFVEALGNAGVIRAVPIYERQDKKIEIVVNCSADTREEAKQY